MSLTSQTTFVVCLWMDFKNCHWSLHNKALTFVNGFQFAILMKTRTVYADIVSWFFTLGEYFFPMIYLHSLTQQPEENYITQHTDGARFDKLVRLFFQRIFIKFSPANIVLDQAPCLLQQHFSWCSSLSQCHSAISWFDGESFFYALKNFFNRHLKLVLPTNFFSCPRVLEFLL